MKPLHISLWFLFAFFCLFSKEGEAESESKKGIGSSDINGGTDEGYERMLHSPGGRGSLDWKGGQAEDESKEKIGNSVPNKSEEEGDGWMLHTPGGGPLDSRCPCLRPEICPRAFGRHPADMLLLGQLPICQDESKVRCCGASMSVITRLVPMVNPKNPPRKEEELNVKINVSNDGSIETKDPKDSELNTYSGPFDAYGRSSELVTGGWISMNITHNENTTISEGEKSENGTMGMSYEEKKQNESETLTSSEVKKNITNERGAYENGMGMNYEEENQNGQLDVFSEQNEDSNILRGEESSNRVNSGETSVMEPTEYFRADMLQLEDPMSLMQQSEGGNLMIVTPMPLTVKAKYQQQIAKEGRASQVMIEDISPKSYINLKNVMHVTHKPDKEVMIVTPQHTTVPIEKHEYVSSMGNTGIHTESTTTESTPFKSFNSSINVNDRAENHDEWKSSVLDNSQGLLAQLSEKVGELEAKVIGGKYTTGSAFYFVDGMNDTISNGSNMKKEATLLPTMISHKQNIGLVNLSLEPQGNISKDDEIQRAIRESQILKKDSRKPIILRNILRPKWSPMRIRKKQSETLNSNLTQSSALSRVNGKNSSSSEDGQDLKNKIESTTISNKRVEVTREKLTLDPIVSPQNFRIGHVEPIMTENTKIVTEMSQFPKLPLIHSNTEDVAINPHFLTLKKIVISSQIVSPTMSLEKGKQRSYGSSNTFESPKISNGTPIQLLDTNAMVSNEQARLTFLRHELLSLFSDLKKWEANNAKSNLKNVHINPSAKHIITSGLKESKSPSLQLEKQEMQKNFKTTDEDFGKRITHTDSVLKSLPENI